MLINDRLSGAPACYVTVSPGVRMLSLFNDTGASLIGPLAAGASGMLQNSQCAVNLTSATDDGTTLTLGLNITYKPGFGGNKIQYLAARDDSGNNTDWQAMGTVSVQ